MGNTKITSPSPKVFISSVYWGLEKIRSDIYSWAKKSGYEAWVFEKSDPHLGKKHPQNIQKVCIENIDDSDLYIGIFHRGYGSSAESHFAKISLVDLELFEAFKEGKPIKYYVLEPFEPEPELQAFFKIVRKLLPDSLTICETQNKLLDTIKRDIDEHFKKKADRLWSKKPFGNFRYFLNSLILNRQKYDEEGGIRFLADKYPIPSTSIFDKERVQEQVQSKIIGLNKLKSYHDRLNEAWNTFEILFNVPWQEKKYHEHLELWDQILGIWATGAAWYGLHGPIYVGRLAADNTLFAIRSLIASHGETFNLKNDILTSSNKTGCIEKWVNLYSLGGALASEYYSIAQSVFSRRLRKRYLLKADSWIEVANRANSIEPNRRREAGLSSIRGHIYMQLGRDKEAFNLFELSLKIRQDDGLGLGSIAEAKADLGHAYMKLGKKKNAEKLLVEGVRDLEKAMIPGFTARAKRKLAEFYLKEGNLKKCVREIIEAEAICKKYGIKDQFNKLVLLSRVSLNLITKLWHNSSTVEVIETKDGYKYIEKN